jgi:hypothetical protein
MNSSYARRALPYTLSNTAFRLNVLLTDEGAVYKSFRYRITEFGLRKIRILRCHMITWFTACYVDQYGNFFQGSLLFLWTVNIASYLLTYLLHGAESFLRS